MRISRSLYLDCLSMTPQLDHGFDYNKQRRGKKKTMRIPTAVLRRAIYLIATDRISEIPQRLIVALNENDYIDVIDNKILLKEKAINIITKKTRKRKKVKRAQKIAFLLTTGRINRAQIKKSIKLNLIKKSENRYYFTDKLIIDLSNNNKKEKINPSILLFCLLSGKFHLIPSEVMRLAKRRGYVFAVNGIFRPSHKLFEFFDQISYYYWIYKLKLCKYETSDSFVNAVKAFILKPTSTSMPQTEQGSSRLYKASDSL